MIPLAVAALVASMAARVGAQSPTKSWKPNHASNGMHCFDSAPNPNAPTSHDHAGGCGCENTPLRLDGRLLMMESSGHGCDTVFPGYNSSVSGDCSYFRLRDMHTGMIIANVSESRRHAFFAAVADHKRRMLWVFGSAHARNNKMFPNSCDVAPHKGCYVGVWNASFDDLTTWSETRKSLVLPDGYSLYNNDVAIVSGPHAPHGVPGLPDHQAVMIIEQRTDDSHKFPFISPFAVNTGSDGDLSGPWVLLKNDSFSLDYPKGAAGEGTGDAPTIRFDPSEGYYYSIGGGWITNGPARSRNLTHWEVSPLAPMAAPDTRTAAVGLPPTDSIRGLNPDNYTAIWPSPIPDSLKEWAANLSKWDWGVTDPDLCCGDGEGPSFLTNTLSRQGAPANATGDMFSFSRMRVSPLELYAWLRSYFPSDGR